MMERQNWLQLTAVQAGGAICLPVFVIGYALGKNYGVESAFLAIMLGNALLLLLALVCGVYSAEKKLSTIQCAIQCFGRRGKGFFSAAMVFSMTGWFAIQLNLMGESLQQLLPFTSPFAGPLAMGIIMTALGVKGLRGVGVLANVSLPLLVATIAFAFYGVDLAGISMQETKPHSLSGMSLVLACSIGAVVDLPTFFRVAKSRKDATTAVWVLFGLVIPAVEMVGVLLSAASVDGGFLEVLMGAHASAVWEIWVLGFVLMAGWTTNSANLYSATVSLEPVLASVPFAMRAMLLGCIGTTLACFPLMEGLEFILQPIGVALMSMGAVMITTFIVQVKTTPSQNFFAWMMGVFVGAVGLIITPVTGIAVLDGFITSMIFMGAFIGISAFKQERVIYEND